MIVVSAALVAVAAVLLVVGFVTSAVWLFFVSMAVSVLAVLFLFGGVRERRRARDAVRDDTHRPALAAALGAADPRPAAPSAAAGTRSGAGPVLAGAEDPTHDQPEHAPQDGERVGRVLVVAGRPGYHVAGCRFLVGRVQEEADVADARAEGFRPCAVCAPDLVLTGRGPDTGRSVRPAAGPDEPRGAGRGAGVAGGARRLERAEPTGADGTRDRDDAGQDDAGRAADPAHDDSTRDDDGGAARPNGVPPGVTAADLAAPDQGPRSSKTAGPAVELADRAVHDEDRPAGQTVHAAGRSDVPRGAGAGRVPGGLDAAPRTSGPGGGGAGPAGGGAGLPQPAARPMESTRPAPGLLAVVGTRARGVATRWRASTQVLLVPGDDRFHRAGCPTVQGGASTQPALRGAAERAGHRPCETCRP